MGFGSGSVRETVRDMDVAAGAPMDGFTAFSRTDPEAEPAALFVSVASCPFAGARHALVGRSLERPLAECRVSRLTGVDSDAW